MYATLRHVYLYTWFSFIYMGYQRGNQNPYIEEEQTKQWPKEKVQKDKQRSTKHTHKANPTENRG
jgi:cytochrome b subunit of formate dehydrogenase